jgi:hypothetical protein
MRFAIIRLVFSVIVLFAGLPVSGEFMVAVSDTLKSTGDTAVFVSPFQKENERCFKCHGQSRYEYRNENLGRTVKAPMFSERVIRRADFYNSNHRSFNCTDCHSDEYVNFPHKGELRMEQTYTCLDCHGGDEKFAQYHFEAIDSGYHQSVHFKMEEEGFSCWKCHNPHSYKINIRTNKDIKEIILYDNNICLHCHSDYERFQLLSDRDEINIVEKHEWLPNQALHFRNVRCIECHAMVNNNILVSHNIRPKEEAVRKCNECHSKNSMLMASLYKFKSKEQRSDGFLNAVILNESYVIGANRNKYLNNLSLIVFFIVIGVMAIHIVIRIILKK